MTDTLLEDKPLEEICRSLSRSKLSLCICPNTNSDCPQHLEYNGQAYCRVELKKYADKKRD